MKNLRLLTDIAIYRSEAGPWHGSLTGSYW